MIIGLGHKAQVGKDTAAEMLLYLISNPEQAPAEVLTQSFLSYTGQADNFKIVKFADKLKETAAIILGCNISDFENNNFKNRELPPEWWMYKDSKGVLYPYNTYAGKTTDKELIVMTPRRFLQLLGTDAGRKIVHPDIWVNATMSEYVPDADGKYPNWIITDVRFPNEAETVRKKEGVLIKVDRLICPKCGNTSDFNYGSTKYSNSNTLTCEECGYKFSEAHESETALDTYLGWDFTIDNNVNDLSNLMRQVREIMVEIKLLDE